VREGRVSRGLVDSDRTFLMECIPKSGTKMSYVRHREETDECGRSEHTIVFPSVASIAIVQVVESGVSGA